MISSKTLRNAAAAALVTLVGTSSAYAQVVVGTDAGGTITGKNVIARETILSTNPIRSGGVVYYRVDGSSTLQVRVPVGMALGATDTALVRVTLDGMVFGQAAVLDTNTDGAADTAVGSVTETLLSGGQAGNSEAVFSVSGAAVVATNYFYLEPTSIGISNAGRGSVTIQVSRTVGGFTFGPTYQVPDAVRLVAGISDDSEEIVNPVASVDTGFTAFITGTGVSGESNTIARVGSVNLGLATVASGLTLRAQAGGAVTARSSLVASTRVGFSGNLSFAKAVYLSNDACASTGSFSLVTGEAGALMWKTGDARATAAQADGRHLCIEADGETQIPETMNYMAEVDDTALANAQFPPVDQQFTLGKINRDGTTVRIPFLSTFDGYNHRIVLSNRGTAPISYEMSFATENGVTATPGDRASGMLQPGVTTIPAADLVTLSGGGRTAATIEAVTSPSSLGVATVLVNREDGSTDTVVYQD